MGLALSRRLPSSSGVASTVNDFELAVCASKELEHILEAYFGATSGRGLHEKLSVAESTGELPPALVRRMRALATVRNKLIHERDFNALPDRARFIADFEAARAELDGLLAYRDAKLRRDAGTDRDHDSDARGGGGGGGGGGVCAVM